MSDKKDNSGDVNRRRLLRGAGAAVAGAVGAGVAASLATPANAAVGDPVLAGDDTNAGASSTSITMADPNNAALVLNNNEGPSLTFGPTDSLPNGSNVSAPGSVIGDQYGNVFTNQVFVDETGANSNFYTRVMTDGWATQVFPIDPVRVLDTRNASLRTRLIGGTRDSSGRLVAGQTGVLDISDQVNGAIGAQINITVVNAAAAGYVTVWSGAGTTHPASSSINYAASAALSNFGQTVVGFVNDTQHDVFGIFTSQTTHVLIDLVGFILFSPAQITSSSSAAAKMSPKLVKPNMTELQKLRNASRPQVKL